MTQFMSKIWTFLNTENVSLINIFLIPATFIENYILMFLFTNILNIQTTTKRKTFYIISASCISILGIYFIPTPYNVLVNYLSMFILIKIFFELSYLKSFLSLLVSIFIFGLCNILLQNPYLRICHITAERIATIPFYRILYLSILYCFLGFICSFTKNLTKVKFTLDLLDSFDKKTKIFLLLDLITGFSTLCLQLALTAFYIETLPVIITILSFLLLMAFLLLSVYSFSRVMKLSMAQKDLRNAEEYNASLEILYDNVKGFKHDFESIVFSLGGYLDSNDIDGAKKYFEDVKKDCKYTSNLSVINPRIINEPAIYSLLTSKYSKAQKMNVEMNIKSFLDLSDLDINMYKFSRTLGILIDNAIEAASSCKNKKSINIIFRRENNRGKSVIIIENTYSNKDVNISEIFNKGFTEKDDHSGRGLWEVKKYIDSASNLKLSTYKNASYFTQKLEIFDEVRNLT